MYLLTVHCDTLRKGISMYCILSVFFLHMQKMDVSCYDNSPNQQI